MWWDKSSFQILNHALSTLPRLLCVGGAQSLCKGGACHSAGKGSQRVLTGDFRGHDVMPVGAAPLTSAGFKTRQDELEKYNLDKLYSWWAVWVLSLSSSNFSD